MEQQATHDGPEQVSVVATGFCAFVANLNFTLPCGGWIKKL